MKSSAILLLFLLADATPEARYFRYQRALANTPSGGGQSCLAVDPAIFAHAAAGLVDLRVYRDGAETPFVLRTNAQQQTTAPNGTQSIALLNPGLRDGHTVFDANMPDGPYSDLDLEVSAQNFIATVTVSGSQAQTGSAATRIGNFTIFDLTSQRLGRSTVLHLPQSDFRYLHFEVNGPITPQSVTGITVPRLVAEQPQYVPVAASSQVIKKGRASVIEFTVPAHVPVDRVRFVLGATPALFSRNVTITATALPVKPATDGAPAPQSYSTQGNLLRVHSVQNGHRIDEEHLEIDTPSADFETAATWTITIENGDDAPLSLQSARLEMVERDLCLEAAANARYTLYYGDPALRAPRYDYATLFALQPHPAQLIAGAEAANSGYQSRPDDRPFTERHPALLWLALIAVIALLATVALRTAKSAAQTPN
jgi:hypothetical protein